MSQLTGLIAHEVMHLALCHHTRQGKRDHDKWNRAADHAINHLLQGAGFDLPLNVLLEPRFTGMSAEAIYDQLLETYDTTLEVIYADRKVRGQETFTKADLPLTLSPKGGGGTDFRPVFDLVEKQGITPCCLVYLTDLCCDRFPDSPPGYPVLWVNTETFRWDDPPFGTVIDMEATEAT
jgi:predicted metal-dependent peptidase